MRGPTASARTVLGITRFVPGDPGDLLRSVGLPRELAPDDRVPARALVDALAEAVRRTGDPTLGIRIATGSPPQRFDVMGYLFASSTTLRAAWHQLGRTFGLWNGGAVVQIREEGEEGQLGLRLVLPRVGPDTAGVQVLAELAMATCLLTARRVTGQALAPRRVAFWGAEPADTSHLRPLFGDDLRFHQPQSALVLDRAALDLPLQGADPGLAEVLRRHADELLQRLPDAGGPLTRQVRERLARAVGEPPELEAVARALGQSGRTLQRRLREEGASFLDLVEAVRRDQALGLMADGRLGTDEIAALCGFSEASAFHRAFRRWTGTTPAAWRAARSAAEADGAR